MKLDVNGGQSYVVDFEYLHKLYYLDERGSQNTAELFQLSVWVASNDSK